MRRRLQARAPGDIVLDPMCGIGTTLVEAIHLGRHAFGIECEPRWAELAEANLALAEAFSPLCQKSLRHLAPFYY